MKEILLFFVKALLNGQAYGIKKYLQFGADSGFSDDLLLNVINTIWDYFRLAGMGIAIIYFLMELNNKMGFESGNVTLKTFAMPFCKLALAILMLSYAPTLMSNMLGFNNVFINKMANIGNLPTVSVSGTVNQPSSSGSSGDGSDSSLIEEKTEKVSSIIEKAGLIKQLGFFLPMLMAWIINTVLGFIWIYKAFSYKIELILKISLTPLAIVDCYNTNSTAVIRWVKSVLALVIYGGMLMLLSRIAMLQNVIGIEEVLENGNLLEWIVEVVKSLILPFAMLGVTGTIKQVCKEALS